MLQIHLLGDTPANIDFDVNEARYQPSQVNAIQAQVFDAAIHWANQPTLTLSELVQCLIKEPEYVV
jgi:hypothetical protein